MIFEFIRFNRFKTIFNNNRRNCKYILLSEKMSVLSLKKIARSKKYKYIILLNLKQRILY